MDRFAAVSQWFQKIRQPNRTLTDIATSMRQINQRLRSIENEMRNLQTKVDELAQVRDAEVSVDEVVECMSDLLRSIRCVIDTEHSEK